MIDVSQAVALIQELVRIPSESSSPTHTDGQAPEARLAHYLSGLCQGLGIEHEVREVWPGRPNFVARFPNPGRPRLLITGHLDTVSAAGMEDPFAARLEGERIWGRGACDDKGPLATALSVLLQLRAAGRSLRHEVIFAGTIDEECSLAGASALREDVGGWDLCIGLEPTSLKIVKAHKGVYRCRIVTHGKAVHSSAPELGENAILSMMEVMRDLQIFGVRLGRHADPELGRSTLAVTQIRGGASINTIPDRCEIAVDVRLLPGQQPKTIALGLQGMVGQRGRVEDLFAARGMQTDMAAPLIGQFQAVLAREGLDPEAVTAGYATDGSELQDGGPCIIWGPGHIAEAHQLSEHIEVEQVRLACQVLAAFLVED